MRNDDRPRPLQWPVIGAAVLAAAALASSLWLMSAIIWPETGQADWSGLASTHENRAERLLASGSTDPSVLDSAEQATWTALQLSPANAWSWLRLAYIDAARDGRLGQAGLIALARSYDASPYGPQVTPWRVGFALQHWTSLTRDLKRQVSSEIRVAVTQHPHMIQVVVGSVADRSGRLAGRAILKTQEAAQRLNANGTNGSR